MVNFVVDADLWKSLKSPNSFYLNCSVNPDRNQIMQNLDFMLQLAVVDNKDTDLDNLDEH